MPEYHLLSKALTEMQQGHKEAAVQVKAMKTRFTLY